MEHKQERELPPFKWPTDMCFVCGQANPNGLGLKFVLGEDGNSCVCEFKLGDAATGPPGYAHGGIIAAILDEAMGKANRFKKKVALTRRMKVEYLRPVPLGELLVVEGRVRRTFGRALYNYAELRSAKGTLLACSRGKFLTIDAEKMFGPVQSAQHKNEQTVDR